MNAMRAAALSSCVNFAARCGFGAAMSCVVLLPASAQQQPSQWAKLPRMQLERQFAGPLQDTIIQRWRDPVDGVICYVYLPITAAHSAPTANGYVEYGANTIGSISCMPGMPEPKRPPEHR